MRLFLEIFFVFFHFSVVLAQSVHYSDIFKGGVCVVGSSTADNSGVANIPFYIEQGSTIKKIFLISYVQYPASGSTNVFDKQIKINGEDLTLSLSENQGEYFAGSMFGLEAGSIGHQTNIYDLTEIIELNDSMIHVQWLSNEVPIDCPSCRFASFMFVIIYENPTLDKTSYSMIINESKNSNSQNFDFTPTIPFDFTKNISLGFHTDRLGASSIDGYNFFINNISIGQINTVENFFSHGVTSNFYYQNGILTGLDNDIADNIISGGDAILNINEYITGNSPINIKYNYIQPTNVVHNFFISSHLAHSTNCEAFPVTVSTDTTICRNETVQLSASGGTQYLWQPATDLSCVYCPNPIFTGDSSRFYTVRIWNNDSCSVVRPVKVNVRQLPVFSSITSTPSDCNGATGKIISSANLSGETYSLNGGTPQNSGNFFNLAPGDYTLSVHELNGCTNDTVITVGSSISTNAFFTATPTQGAPPLWVNFTNQSTNASNYEWLLNGISQGNNFPASLFDTTGNYTVTLVAWPENPSCSDSFELQIYVFDSLIVQVPNVFTPNNDQSNDLFGITTNSPVTVEYQLFNRWGNEMIAGKSSLGTVTPSGLTFTPLWDGNNATEGTYFYKLTVTAQTPKGEQKRALEGFFVLVR